MTELLVVNEFVIQHSLFALTPNRDREHELEQELQNTTAAKEQLASDPLHQQRTAEWVLLLFIIKNVTELLVVNEFVIQFCFRFRDREHELEQQLENTTATKNQLKSTVQELQQRMLQDQAKKVLPRGAPKLVTPHEFGQCALLLKAPICLVACNRYLAVLQRIIHLCVSTLDI